MKPYKVGGTIVDNLIQYEQGAFNNEIFNQEIIKLDDNNDK